MSYKKSSRSLNLHRVFVMAMETVAAVALLISTQALPASASATGTLYLAPASQNLAAGDNLTVTLYEDSGADKVNALQANLTYSPDLQYVSANYSSSVFSIQAAANGGGGKIDIARGATAPVQGAHVVGTITFKALSDGVGKVDFACINSSSCKNGNALVSSTNNGNVLTTQTGGSYTIAGTSSSTGGSSGSGSNTTTDTGSGQVTGTASADVTITVNNPQGKPISGATVTLNGQSVKTNQQGHAVFQNVPAGAQSVIIKAGGKTTKQLIQVAAVDPATKNNANQQFSLVASPGNNMWLYGIIGLVVLILIAAFIARRAISRSSPAGPAAPATPDAGASSVPPASPTPQDPGNVITPENKP